MRKVVKDHPYLESGLTNVVLKDLPVYVCACGEEMPVIGGVDILHGEIADAVAAKSSPLTGEEARFLRKQTGMKAKELAEVMGVTKVTVSRWENSAANLGAGSDRLMRLIYVKKREEETGRIRKGVIGALKSIETARGEGGPHHEKVITVKVGGKKDTGEEIA